MKDSTHHLILPLIRFNQGNPVTSDTFNQGNPSCKTLIKTSD